MVVGTTGRIQVWEITVNSGSFYYNKSMFGYETVTLELVSTKPLYSRKNWIKFVEFTKRGYEIVSISRFGSMDVFEDQLLSNRMTLESELGHITSASFDNETRMVYLSGTKTRVGIGEGYIETISLKDKKSLSMTGGFFNYPIQAVFRPRDSLLIADSKKVSSLKFDGR